ncbi:hypothetical protein RUE5091_01017 [Ruegeria denitrificans]|uniref:Aldose 1-epimerase n=1 Tax=Ruegeria denitrificans TaxID=1715692 RepID=A0A0N7M8T5_9RHOB|nr:hypothetical protein [Ruegeria denitrificans]CUJ90712.1 hypothetical protein RUE5091_01017 [Ruegeria denitrificans]
MIDLSATGIRLSFDLQLGLIESFSVNDGGAQISPLHRAPWVGTDEVLPEGIAPHLEKLGGDFFCAPFGATEGPSPLHGWPPNSRWILKEKTGSYLCAELEKTVFGARLQKEITLHPGHPFIYQRHTFIGGEGLVPVANHANVSLPNGGIIQTSQKQCWRTPKAAQEVDPALGYSALRYPAESRMLTSFPGKDGSVNLSNYPWSSQSEDFAVGLDSPDEQLGWTAVIRPVEGDVFLSLKSAQALPMTMLWHSNGGRYYAPWSSRHFACLGIEEGAALPILGTGEDSFPEGRGAIHLDPHRQVEIIHVIGALRWRSGARVRTVETLENQLLIRSTENEEYLVPFDVDALNL